VLKSGRSFKCALDHVKTKFYRSVNAILYRAKNAGSELVCVKLLKSVCLPALLYAVEVVPFTKTDMSMLDHLVDRVFYRIFGCTSSEDIQFLRPCWTCLVLASVLMTDRLGLSVHFLVVSRGLLCSAMLFSVDA